MSQVYVIVVPKGGGSPWFDFEDSPPLEGGSGGAGQCLSVAKNDFFTSLNLC